MRKFPYFSLASRAIVAAISLAAFLPNTVLAQAKSTTDCERDLDDAKLAYSEGQLGSVRSFLSDECLFSKKLSRENKVQAYRLLTETSLYSNNLDQASFSFESLLRYNPLFEVDSTDQWASYDLIYLSRTYRRNPIISWYGSAGANYSQIETLQTYGASNTISTKTDLNWITLGWNIATGIELPVYNNFDLLVEGNLAIRNYLRADELYIVSSSTNVGDGTVYPFGTLDFKEVQTWIDVPVLARYNYHWRKKIIPYAYAGIAPNFLASAKLTGLIRRNSTDGRGGDQVVGDQDNTISLTRKIVTDGGGQEDEYRSTYKSLRTGVNVSLVAGVGCKFRLGSNFLFFDIRYNRFLLNAVNIDNRYTQKELIYRYGYVDNDFRIDNVALSFGYMKSFYKPRKKRQYDPLLAALAFDKQMGIGDKGKKGQNVVVKTSSEEANREMKDAVNSSKQDKKNFIDAVRSGRATVNDLPKD
jgi:hypothetical protein